MGRESVKEGKDKGEKGWGGKRWEGGANVRIAFNTKLKLTDY